MAFSIQPKSNECWRQKKRLGVLLKGGQIMLKYEKGQYNDFVCKLIVGLHALIMLDSVFPLAMVFAEVKV